MNAPRDHDLDRLMDDDSGELGRLYRRLPRTEPPRRLDRRILGNAARAVRGHTPRRHRWVMALGSAAGVVLAAGIAWHVGQDALREQSRQEGTLSVPVAVPFEPITSNRRKQADAARDVDARAAQAPPAEPQPLAKPAAAKKVEQPSQPKRAPPKTVVHGPSPTPSPSPSAPLPREFRAARTQPTDAAPAAPAAAVAQPDTDAAAALDKAARPRMRGGGAPAPSSSMELRRDMQLAPEDWLAHIRQLLHQGRRQQAIESLRLFHNAHPQHRLSAELQTLLD